METADIPVKVASDWQPITNKHDLAVLGKLGEEAAELASAISRCIIQGLSECEPTTGKVNRVWLEEEVADVFALAALAIIHLGLDISAIMERQQRKIAFKAPWFEGLRVEDES